MLFCRARESVQRHQQQHRLNIGKLKSHVNQASKLAVAEAHAIEQKVSERPFIDLGAFVHLSTVCDLA